MTKIQGDIFKIENEFITICSSGFFQDLEENQKYNIEFKKFRKSRSLEQNSMMWGIINKISEETNNDIMDVYCTGLEYANAKSEFLMCIPEALESIKKSFRAVKICEKREYNGKDMLVLKCYIGSSKYDTKEMTTLIDYFIRQASELGIYIEEK